jgi:hypothetical protein
MIDMAAGRQVRECLTANGTESELGAPYDWSARLYGATPRIIT